MTIDVLKPLVPGDDYALKFTFTDPDTGAIEDQTGASLRVVVKVGPDDLDADALSDFSVNASGADALAGIIRATLPAVDTRDYPQGTYVYIQARRTRNGLKQSPINERLRTKNSVIDDN